jgi:hypothetical protein
VTPFPHMTESGHQESFRLGLVQMSEWLAASGEAACTGRLGLKSLRQTDKRVDAVGGARHSKVGTEIEFPIVSEVVQNSGSQDTARGIFITEQRRHLKIGG